LFRLPFLADALEANGLFDPRNLARWERRLPCIALCYTYLQKY